MKNLTYHSIQQKEYENMPDWAVRRFEYTKVKHVIDELISENNRWIEYFQIRNQVQNIVAFRERIFQLEIFLKKYEENMKPILDENI